LDRQIAEKYFDMGWIQEGKDDGELHGWNRHPCDLRYPPYTSHYYGVVPHYSSDPEAAAAFERKFEEYGCAEEYARLLAEAGVTLESATPEQRCRAAVELHPFYEARVKEALAARAEESNRAYEEKEERADLIIEGIRERLVRLVDQRAFRFVDTTWEEAVEYLGRLSEFEGFDENEIYGARCTQGLFPHVYRAFLRQMGRARGELFRGSEVEPSRLSDYREAAEELLKSCGVESFLDENSVVFMFHQGYTFSYFQAAHGPDFDAPVFQYVECDPAPKQIAAGFAEMLDAEVRLMEENNRRGHKIGGYFLTVEGGFTRMVYPALGEGRRPLDCEDEFI
jgi:hypothetical protein